MVTELATSQGVLELHPKGFGFLRNPGRHYVAQPGDAYVPAPLIHRYSLREGLLVAGPTEAALRGNGPRLKAVEQIEGGLPDAISPPQFRRTHAHRSHEHIILETGPDRSPPASWTCSRPSARASAA